MSRRKNKIQRLNNCAPHTVISFAKRQYFHKVEKANFPRATFYLFLFTAVTGLILFHKTSKI